jgi:murein DD-endopeptidase MepM/ murein hydrolase activator NlpD
MRVCQNYFPGMRALRNAAFAVSTAALLSACSNSGVDRLSGDTSSSDSYTASVNPVDENVVQAQPLDGGTGTQTFSARPVQSFSSNEMPPAEPVLEQAPEPVPLLAEAQAGSIHKVKPGETLYSLGRSYQLTHVAIANANDLSPDASLKIGQTIRIPAEGKLVQQAAMPDAAPAEPLSDDYVLKAPEKVASRTNAAETVTDESPVEATPDEAPVAAVDPSNPVFRWPVQGRVISGFGSKPGGLRNEGINISVPEGTSVRAADSGVVAYAGNELKGYGNLILIRHEGGFVTAYAHNKELIVKRGDTVKRGDEIAKAGQTGSVDSPQLHFEVRKGPTALDPIKYLGATAANN